MDGYNRTLVELGTFCNETQAWFLERYKKQNETALSADPVLMVSG